MAFGDTFKIKGLYIAQEIQEACAILEKLLGKKLNKGWYQDSYSLVSYLNNVHSLKLDQGCSYVSVARKDIIGGKDGKVKLILLSDIEKILKTKSPPKEFVESFSKGYNITNLEPHTYDTPDYVHYGWITNEKGLFIQEKYDSKSRMTQTLEIEILSS